MRKHTGESRSGNSTIRRIADEVLTELVRPIATAPRELNPEGEPIPIIVYDPSEGGWQAGVWVCAGQRGSMWFRQGWRAASDWDLELRPTHWMPMPPHPHELFAANDVEAGDSHSTRGQPSALVGSDA